jgi:hypothetical protein
MIRLRLVALAATLLTPLAPAAHATPATSLAFAGIRPGTLLVMGSATPVNSFDVSACTANFVYQDAPGAFDPSQQLYIGTAGHCVDLGETVRAIAVAPGQTTPVLVTVGTVVLDDDNLSHDLALIAIDPAMNAWVSPSVAYWGGPTGVYTGPSNGITPGTQVGQGGGVGGFVPRAGLIDYSGGNFFRWTSLTTLGDSGSPVTTADGLAVGDLVRLSSTDPAWIESVGPTVALMQTVSGKTLSTCPTRTPWPAPGCPVV